VSRPDASRLLCNISRDILDNFTMTGAIGPCPAMLAGSIKKSLLDKMRRRHKIKNEQRLRSLSPQAEL